MHGSKLFKVPLDGVTVTYLSRRNALHPVSPNDSLLDICEILAKGVHRVPVMDKGEIVNIISQSSIIQFLHKHNKELAPFTSKKIGEIKIGSKPVITVNKTTVAIDAFRLMDNKKISGLAVVDEAGRFVGNTSASDLKLFMQTLSLEILKQPVSQFLNTLRQESIDIRVPTISVGSNDTVQTAISKLAMTKIHKLFVADDGDGYKPKMVVSITDILKYLMA
jgi:CBS domain-containing protein